MLCQMHVKPITIKSTDSVKEAQEEVLQIVVGRKSEDGGSQLDPVLFSFGSYVVRNDGLAYYYTSAHLSSE